MSRVLTPTELPAGAADFLGYTRGMPRFSLAVIVILATLSASASAQKPAAGDWPLHNLDAESGRFSPLDQINTANAATLAIKWQFDLQRPASVGSATPIVVGGVMYVNSGQTLIAIDGATGQAL